MTEFNGMNLKVGDKLKIMITAMTGEYEGEVVALDKDNYPLIKVSWMENLLKPGDYIIMDKISN